MMEKDMGSLKRKREAESISPKPRRARERKTGKLQWKFGRTEAKPLMRMNWRESMGETAGEGDRGTDRVDRVDRAGRAPGARALEALRGKRQRRAVSGPCWVPVWARRRRRVRGYWNGTVEDGRQRERERERETGK